MSGWDRRRQRAAQKAQDGDERENPVMPFGGDQRHENQSADKGADEPENRRVASDPLADFGNQRKEDRDQTPGENASKEAINVMGEILGINL